MASPSGRPWLEREDVNDITVVRFALPRLQAEDTIRTLFNQISSLVDVGRRKLVLNLSSLEFLSSFAIGKLVMLNKKTQAVNGRLALCQVTPAVNEVFQVMHLGQVFHLYEDEQQAVQSFSPLERHDVDDVAVLKLKGKTLGDQDIAFLAEELNALVTGAGRRKLVLDLSNLESMPDGAVAEFARQMKARVQAAGAALVLCQVAPPIHAVLGKVFFNIAGSEQEALQSF